MNAILILVIKGYQSTIGRILPRVCRFEPSCSTYAVEALHVHGICKGSLMSIWRILRCNPFHPGGCDPVPPKSPENCLRYRGGKNE